MQVHSDEEIINLIEQYMHGSDNADQVGYRKQIYGREFADKERFLWAIKHIAALGQYENKRILDVGCGLGWHAFAMALLDSRNQVFGIDILPSMIEAMKESLETMRGKGIDANVTAINGDICDLNLPEGSFDSIYSMEAIEHVHDLKKMFKRCNDLLMPGGTLILINDSNPLNHKTRDETMAMWQEREHSWDWIAKLKNWRPIEHGNAKPFAVMREEIVRSANPDLAPEQVRQVVEGTAGLLKAEIEQIASGYTNQTKLPTIGQYDKCRNPETGEYAERLLNPFELADMLKQTGFRTTVRHMFRKFPISLTNSIQFRPLNNILFNLRGIFVVLATKP
jgi:2-polyprenyl-3-methyl-5-hydroxy-6-metoxy-1,4-benzoquinol methylase